MTMRYSIRTLVVAFVFASLTLMGQQQQPAARGGQAGGARGQGAAGGRGGTPAPITWPSPPLPAGPIVLETAIQRKVKLFITKGLNQPFSMAFLPDAGIMLCDGMGLPSETTTLPVHPRSQSSRLCKSYLPAMAVTFSIFTSPRSIVTFTARCSNRSTNAIHQRLRIRILQGHDAVFSRRNATYALSQGKIRGVVGHHGTGKLIRLDVPDGLVRVTVTVADIEP